MTCTSSDRGSTPKAWSSGRVLTEEQRDRKREANRISARRRKGQFKERLERLEAQVQAQSQNSLSITQQDGTSAEETSVHKYPSLLVQQQSPRHEDFQNLLEGQPQPEIRPNSIVPVSRNGLDTQPASNAKPYDAFMAACILLTVPLSPPVASRESLSSGVSESVSDFCVQLNKSMLTFSSDIICSDDLENQNMLVRAILNGWDVLNDLNRRCPLWTILKYVDMALFLETPAIERLALLRNVHIMGLYQLRMLAAEDLPIWWRPRPVQLRFPHHPTIDYLPWPGLRERFILCDLKMTNDFWALFGRCFRLLWPYPITTCYEEVPGTNMMCFGSLFKEKTWDLNSWCMTEEWFNTYPETADDINRAPLNLSTAIIEDFP